MELKPSIFAQVTEAIASADGSTGWVVCQSNGCSTTAAYLDAQMAQEIFGRPDGISPGVRPVRRMRRRRSTAAIASPATGASSAAVRTRRGWVRTAGRGHQETKTFLFPKSSANSTISGIRWACAAPPATNTRSTTCSFRTSARFIATATRFRRDDGPLYRFTSNQLYSIGFGGVALGIARGTMDAFLALPREKTRRGAGKPMVENNVVQSQFAQSEARWRSARLFLHAAADEAWKRSRNAAKWTLEQRTRLRLASTWAIQSAREIVQHDLSDWSARLPCSKKIRSSAGCATSILLRNRPRDGNFTMRRWVRSCSA